MSQPNQQTRGVPHLWVIDLLAYMLLAFAIGVAVSVALGGAVLVLSSEARSGPVSEEPAPAAYVQPLKPSDAKSGTLPLGSQSGARTPI
jgi:hypothetical protein